MEKVDVGIIMGSKSDLDIMCEAAKTLSKFSVSHSVDFISAHRTPEEMVEYAATAKPTGKKIIIAGAGGSAHLPGMTASHTPLPVIAVPIKRDNHDHEALWSNVKMPPGIPLATMPENGAHNAALMAIEILSLSDPALAEKYDAFKESLRNGVQQDNAELQEKGWEQYLKDYQKEK